MESREFTELINQGKVQVGDRYPLPGFMPRISPARETVSNVRKDVVKTMILFGNVGEDDCMVCEKSYYGCGAVGTPQTVPLGSSTYHNLLPDGGEK